MGNGPGQAHRAKHEKEHDTHLSARDPLLPVLPLPLPSVLRRMDDLRDAGMGLLEGLTVADDRVLSVLVLVRELKREPASFLVIVARPSREGVEPCHSQETRLRKTEGTGAARCAIAVRGGRSASYSYVSVIPNYEMDESVSCGHRDGIRKLGLAGTRVIDDEGGVGSNRN
ncbi:hypothetical protein BDP55DRAFT_314022 [Colletotrichum godetiae]|uniref:Uncharacterized protein n=1 Tax=Colletotrichum godetiae TaxID=1209918 RepID=A0AAJ0AXR0_9PEZI|nr:uncharacterized protein BDP55DRAFT_314022 [Colletotrichum godetiae]KAK1690946.1 hypothetical protein BDP55DRAFT_314022 [Colletotrichum godetiae]